MGLYTIIYYIHLRMSRDGTRLLDFSAVRLFVGIRSSLHSLRFGQLLHCVHRQIDVINFGVRNFCDPRVYGIGLIAIRDVSPLFCESLEMDSEGRIIEVVLGTQLSDYDRRTGDNTTGHRTGRVQAVRTQSRSKRQFGSFFLTLLMTLYVDSRPRVKEPANTYT